MAEEHVYRLSSIDQSLIRTYIRYCLCFPCEDADIPTVTESLLAATKRTVTHTPIVAGTVRRAGDGDQHGHLEVSVTLAQVEGFAPTIKHFNTKPYIPTYTELSATQMAPMGLMGKDFTPLPDKPDPEGSPAFAVQANFIRGGLIVTFYLHHSVADIHGLARIMREMSGDMPSRKLTDSDLRSDALERSRLRDQLSQSCGVTADPAEHPEYNESLTDEASEASHLEPCRGCSRVFGFDLELIEGTKNLINERFHYYQEEEERLTHISGFNCIAAILWKAVNRASWPNGAPDELQPSTPVIPVNIRNRTDPPLGIDFFGNADTHATAHSTVTRLGMPLELTNIAQSAWQIRTSTARVTEHYVRTAIAAINQREHLIENNIPSRSFDRSLVITSWADLPVEEAHLGLGLGKPEWGRKLGRTHSAFGCIVLPVKRERGVWEVTVQVTEDVMDHLVRDEGLMKFVKWMA